MKMLDNEKHLGMAWYKFLVYFALFAGSVFNFIYGVNYLIGGIYYVQTNGQFTAEIIYDYYGKILKVTDVIFGLFLIILSFLGIVLRQKLAKYSSDAIKMVYVFYSLSFGMGCLYAFSVSAITDKPIGVSTMVSLIINAVVLYFNIQYFRRRSHLFMGIAFSDYHDVSIVSESAEENNTGSSFSNAVRINLSPIGQKQQKENIGYHVYGADVKYGNDNQQQNIDLSNGHLISTYKPLQKQKYCSHCGSKIDNKTRKCTGCEKQYFKLNVFVHMYGKVIINIAVALLLIVSIATNIYFICKEPEVKYAIPDIYKESREYWINNHNKVDFIDEFIVFIEDDGTDFYHKYECDKFVGDYFWAYNIEAAEYNGYKPCPLCHDD